MNTMRRVSFRGDRVIEIVDVDMPSIAGDQVLVRIAASALCGSEMRGFRGDGHSTDGNGGHEAAGVVVEVGADVGKFAVGDRVGLCAIVGCGHCAECDAGRTTWCAERAYVDDMHSEYVAIAARACHLLPDDIDWSTGVLISGDGLGVPFHSLTKFPEKAKNVAVFGLGPVGLGAVMLHSYLGRTVIGVDLSPERLALAKDLGASATVTADSDPESSPNAVRSLTGGIGADVCIEAAGSPITARACFKSVRTAGTVIFNGEQSLIEVSPSEDLIRRDITASGAWFYHFSEFEPMLDLVRNGFRAERLVTHKFSFEDAASAYAAMDRGLTGKVLLEHKWH